MTTIDPTLPARAAELLELLDRASIDPGLYVKARVLLADFRTERERMVGALRAADDIKARLESLHAMVWGECPSLLEDHHADGKILDALERFRAARSALPREEGRDG